MAVFGSLMTRRKVTVDGRKLHQPRHGRDLRPRPRWLSSTSQLTVTSLSSESSSESCVAQRATPIIGLSRLSRPARGARRSAAVTTHRRTNE